MRTFCALVLTAALAVPALAQPPGGGRGRGMGGGMGGGPAMLLRSEDVQKDIKLTDEQKEKLKTFQTKVQEDMQAMRGPDVDQEKRQELGKKIADDTAKFLKEALTDEQNKRLKEISLQNTVKNNPGALATSEEYATALKITDDQKTKIKEIADQARKDRQEVMGGGGGGGGGGQRRQPPTPEQQKKLDALSKEAGDKIMEVLTADQKKSLQEMEGKPFEGKFPTFGGGGRRGGGGGR